MIHSIKVPIYGFVVKFLIQPTDEELRKCRIKRLDKKIYFATTHGHKAIVFWCTPRKITKGLVAHEIFHLAIRLGQNIGLGPITNPDVEEAYAYLVDYLTDEFYKITKKK